MNMKTLATEVVVTGKDADFFPSWMPDNRHVLMTTGSASARRVARVAIDTRQIEDVPGLPARSPDGSTIALEVEDGGYTQIWILNRDGTGLRRITASAGQHWPHTWAPDNDRIVFAGERDGVWNVWTVSTSSGVPTQLTRFTTPNGYVRYPAWSPLNDRIVFEHATMTANVWIGRLTGGGIRTQ